MNQRIETGNDKVHATILQYFSFDYFCIHPHPDPPRLDLLSLVKIVYHIKRKMENIEYTPLSSLSIDFK